MWFIFTVFTVLCLLTVGIIYILSITFYKKPLYISPLSITGLEDKTIVSPYQNETIKKELILNGIAYSQIVSSSDSTYLIYLKHGEEVFLSSKKDIKTQISSLQFILSRLTMEGKSILRLDLRFDKPVITLK